MKQSGIHTHLTSRLIVVFLTILMLMGLTAHIFETMEEYLEYEESFINSVSRLNTLAQAMTENALEVVLLNRVISSPDPPASAEPLRESKKKIQAQLLQHRNEFDRILTSLDRGYMAGRERPIRLDGSTLTQLAPRLESVFPVWQSFSDAVIVVADYESTDSGIAISQKRISDSSEALTLHADRIAEVVIDTHWARNARVERMYMVSLLILFLIVSLSLLGIYFHILLPFNTFYNHAGFAGTIRKSWFPALFDIKPVMREVNRLNDKVRKLIDVVFEINNTSSFPETLEYIFSAFKEYIPYSYIGVAVYKDFQPEIIVASYGVSDGSYPNLPGRLVGYEIEVEKTSLQDIQENGQPRIINDLEAYSLNRRVRMYTRIILEEGIRSSITLPLMINNRPLGFIFFSSKEKEIYRPEHAEFLSTIGSAIALSFDKNIFANDLVYSSILALAKLAESRDEDTGDHLERMKRYTGLLLKCLKDDRKYEAVLTSQYMQDIERFSPMHDIGKVSVRDDVLLKPGRLTFEEFEHMKTHTVYGAAVMAEAERNIRRSGRSLFTVGMEIAESHHERWDGAGYPKGLQGESIPLSARVVALADVLDALTSKRPYKKAYTFEESAQIILESSGTQFDPDIIDTFQGHLMDFKRLHTKMKLGLFIESEEPELEIG